MKYGFVIVGALILGIVVWVLNPKVNANITASTQSIPVDEIGKSIQLVGRLGVPLGEKMELTGYWHYPETTQAKDGSIRFSVTSVNGNMLSQPIEFSHAQFDVTDAQHRNIIPEFKNHRELEDQVWTLIAYETGRIQMMPDEYQSKSPVFPIVGMPYYTKPFTSQIVAGLKSTDGQTNQ
ncbi:MAG: hypothetical protein ACK5YR_14370 [Pirellula sp.]